MSVKDVQIGREQLLLANTMAHRGSSQVTQANVITFLQPPSKNTSSYLLKDVSALLGC